MPADTSALDAAVIAVLGDATLATYCTNGVHWDEAPHGSTAFVIVSQQDHEDGYVQSTEGTETVQYLIKAVIKGTAGATVKSAAARIHTLLQDIAMTATGYRVLSVTRQERIRYTEVDESNDDRWQHRGGRYQVMAEPT